MEQSEAATLTDDEVAVLKALEDRTVLGACDCGECAHNLVNHLERNGWVVIREDALDDIRSESYGDGYESGYQNGCAGMDC